MKASSTAFKRKMKETNELAREKSRYKFTQRMRLGELLHLEVRWRKMILRGVGNPVYQLQVYVENSRNPSETITWRVIRATTCVPFLFGCFCNGLNLSISQYSNMNFKSKLLF
jgi:hypothetical protein